MKYHHNIYVFSLWTQRIPIFYSSGIVEVITGRDVLAEELSGYKAEAERTAAEKKTWAKTTAATEASQEEFLRDQVIIFNQCKYTQTHTKTCS